jgi:uncharacterized membrane protein YczE
LGCHMAFSPVGALVVYVREVVKLVVHLRKPGSAIFVLATGFLLGVGMVDELAIQSSAFASINGKWEVLWDSQTSLWHERW